MRWGKNENMDNSILKRYMSRFSLVELEGFLGEDLLDSLLEWYTGNEFFKTKSRLSDMILSIYGIEILKDNKFRYQILKSLEPEKLADFRIDLPKKYADCSDLATIAEVVSNASWRENALNDRLLSILGYKAEQVFCSRNETEILEEKISSYDKFYELLDYQYVIRQRALNILTSPYPLRKFLIHMPTGTGKTKTAVHIICHHYNYNLHKQGLVIWIAHTTELLQQAYDTFVSVWKNIGNGDITTYRCWGKAKLDIDDKISGFMVCGIQKLQSIETNDPETFKKLVMNAALVVYDEAHKAAASETRALIGKFMIKKAGMKDRSLMGLSATPGRSTEFSFDNDILSSMFGNRIIEIDTRLMNEVNMSKQEAINAYAETDIIKYFQNRGVLAKVEKEELIYDQSLTEEEMREIKITAYSNGYEDFSKKALETIGKNKKRNLRIMQRLRELNKQKRPTIVFACSVKHGQLLSSMLTLENIPNALVTGNMENWERRKAITDFKSPSNDMNILINYEVLTTGFDATNIECVFIARPTQSVVLYSQMLGRGLRGPQMGGNEKCLLIDIKDNLGKFNENMAFSHFNNYWNL